MYWPGKLALLQHRLLLFPGAMPCFNQSHQAQITCVCEQESYVTGRSKHGRTGFSPSLQLSQACCSVSKAGSCRELCESICVHCSRDGVVRNPHDGAENERCYPVDVWRSETVKASQQPEGGRRKQVAYTHEVQANPKSPIERHGAYQSHRKISPDSPQT